MSSTFSPSIPRVIISPPRSRGGQAVAKKNLSICSLICRFFSMTQPKKANLRDRTFGCSSYPGQRPLIQTTSTCWEKKFTTTLRRTKFCRASNNIKLCKFTERSTKSCKPVPCKTVSPSPSGAKSKSVDQTANVYATWARRQNADATFGKSAHWCLQLTTCTTTSPNSTKRKSWTNWAPFAAALTGTSYTKITWTLNSYLLTGRSSNAAFALPQLKKGWGTITTEVWPVLSLIWISWSRMPLTLMAKRMKSLKMGFLSGRSCLKPLGPLMSNWKSLEHRKKRSKKTKDKRELLRKNKLTVILLLMNKSSHLPLTVSGNKGLPETGTNSLFKKSKKYKKDKSDQFSQQRGTQLQKSQKASSMNPYKSPNLSKLPQWSAHHCDQTDLLHRLRQRTSQARHVRDVMTRWSMTTIRKKRFTGICRTRGETSHDTLTAVTTVMRKIRGKGWIRREEVRDCTIDKMNGGLIKYLIYECLFLMLVLLVLIN